MKGLLQLYRNPTIRERAERELAEAREQLLAAESQKDYVDSLIFYNRNRIARLRNSFPGLGDPVAPTTNSAPRPMASSAPANSQQVSSNPANNQGNSHEPQV